MINPMDFREALRVYVQKFRTTFSTSQPTLRISPDDYLMYDTYLLGLGIIVMPDESVHSGNLELQVGHRYYRQDISYFISINAPQKHPVPNPSIARIKQCTCGCATIKSERHSAWCDAL